MSLEVPLWGCIVIANVASMLGQAAHFFAFTILAIIILAIKIIWENKELAKGDAE